MSDNSITLPAPAKAQETSSHGRHRGPVSAQDGEAAPSGRHRKASEEAEQSGITAA